MNALLLENAVIAAKAVETLRRLGKSASKVIQHEPPEEGWSDCEGAEKFEPFWEFHFEDEATWRAVLSALTDA